MMLSVIIPVYNSKEYIESCVRSVLAAIANCSEYTAEIICVDDGSKDGSGAILDRLTSEINSQYASVLIKVAHRANAGVSVARNIGLDMASGKYIVFVDSDDCITSEALRAAVSFMESSPELDVWIGQRRAIADNGDELPVERQPCSIQTMVSTAPIHDFMRINGRYWLYGAVGKVFRGDKIRANHLRFDSRLNIGEDALFMATIYSLSRKVFVAGDVFYLRRLHSGSLVSRDWAKLVPQYYMAIIGLESFAREHELMDKVSLLVAQWAMSRFRVLLDRGYSFNFKARYIDDLVNNSDFKKVILGNIAKYAPWKFSVVAILMRLAPKCLIRFGLKTVVRVMRSC